MKRGVLWHQLASEIEPVQMLLVTTTYGYGSMASGKAECCTVVVTMVHIILQELRKVRAESETEYGSDTPLVMVGQ